MNTAISIFNFDCDAKMTQFIILMSKLKIFNSIKLKIHFHC